jgi:hypothetical protein
VTASLRDLQEWFAEVVMHDGTLESAIDGAKAGARVGATRAAELERVLTRGPRLSAFDRLAVYHYAYRARLVECLVDDFPAVAFAMGSDAFEVLASRYIDAHPSTGPNLNGFGRSFAAFARASGVPHAELLSDLAALEWAMVEAIHAADAPTLPAEALATVPADGWARVVFATHPSFRIVRSRFAVNAYFQAFRDEKAVPFAGGLPALGEDLAGTAVVRREQRVWRMTLTRPMALVLQPLAEGQCLGEALGHLEASLPDPEALQAAAGSLMVWFREWVATGFFSGLRLSEPPAP